MATTPVFSDLQSINPSAIVELFDLKTDNNKQRVELTYRFHNGSNLNANLNIFIQLTLFFDLIFSILEIILR